MLSVVAADRLKHAAISFWKESIPLKIIAFLIVTLFLLEGFNTLLPPESGSDAEAFYLAFPKLIAASHRLLPMTGGYEAFTQIGLNGEMHFAVLMSVCNPLAAKLFVWPISLAIGLMIVGLGSSVGLGRLGNCIALAILVTSTAFTKIIWDGKVDLFATAMGLSAYYWALQPSNFKGAMTLAGLFTGFSLVAKFSFIPTLLPGVILIVFLKRRIELKSACSRSFWLNEIYVWSLFAAWVLLPFIPQFLKNACLFGQPFAPFVGPTAKALLEQTWFSPQVTQRIVLTYPLTLVLGNYPMQHGSLSPLLLAFSPLVLAMQRHSTLFASRLFQLTIAGAVGVAIWLFLRPSVLAPRYILAALLCFIPLVGYATECALSAARGGRTFRTVIFLCCMGMLAHEVATAQTHAKKALDLVRGYSTECTLSGGFCNAAAAINNDASLGDRVFMGAYSSYWLRPDLIENLSRFEEQIFLRNRKAPEEAWNYLREHGFRYVLLFKVTHPEVFALLDISRVPQGLKVTGLLTLDNFFIYRLDDSEARTDLNAVRPPNG
jgi:hypothetical protein